MFGDAAEATSNEVSSVNTRRPSSNAQLRPSIPP